MGGAGGDGGVLGGRDGPGMMNVDVVGSSGTCVTFIPRNSPVDAATAISVEIACSTASASGVVAVWMIAVTLIELGVMISVMSDELIPPPATDASCSL